MSEIKWTDAQLAAIKSRGNVQVAASAGTGKTAVLSYRCIDLLLDENAPADIDRILVLTFTEDAAAEMKERIAATLAKYANGENRARLKKQLMRIEIADISTIHSFCRKIIADNFYRLGIDPAFGIIEGDEQKLLREEILADVVEKAWESEQLSGELKAMLEGRDPDLKKGVLKNVYAIDDFLNSLVDPESWMKMCRKGDQEALWQQLASILKYRIEICRSLCRQARELDESLTEGYYALNISDFETGLDILEEAVDNRSRQQFEAQLDALIGMRFKTRPRGSDESAYFNARSPVTETAKKKILAKIREELASSDILDAVEKCCNDDACAMLELVEMFRDEYRRRKRELNCLDFSDLERLALELLSSSDGGPSETARELRAHYQYVFVDEYQDVNKLQDRIVELVCGGRNRFIVGDVKQSIYSWRQARPELFLGRIDSADKSGASNIYLTDNFRCRRGIIELVNSVFARIMNKQTAGMDYDENAALRFGARWYKPLEEICCGEDPCCNELHIISSDEQTAVPGDEEQENAIDQSNANQRQAALIARRIRSLVGVGDAKARLKVAAKDGNVHDVDYGDIVILLRSLKGRVNEYVDILRQFNIPVEASVTGSYFESPEINDCLAILKILDNPMRDIEFAAAMRCPVFGFSDSQLLRIRTAEPVRSKAFYTSVLEYASSGSDRDLAACINNMLETLEQWRQVASRSHIAQVVWLMLRHNDFLSFASALPGGLQKRGDLLKLHERAIQFEGFVSTRGNPSLSRFVDFIERLRESEGDWSQAETDTPRRGSVRIMSIHKSKGLEFPVVFLPNMEKNFNAADTREICLLDEQLPMGLKVHLQQTGNKHSSDSFNVIKERRLASCVAEEMRTLYVAMTRAREKLIMVCDLVKKDKGQIGSYLNGRLDELDILAEKNALNWWLADPGTRSSLDWLVAAKRNEPALRNAISCGGRLDDLVINVTDAADLPLEIEPLVNNDDQKDVDSGDTEALKRLKQRLVSEYKYQSVLSLPVKNSVSAITHRDDEFKVDYFDRGIDKLTCARDKNKDVDIDPRTIGTATHLVFENLPIDKRPRICDAEKTLERLVNSGAVSPQIAAKIDINGILAFFDTEPAKLIFEEGTCVYREYPFTMALSPAECGYGNEDAKLGDDIIVQGIIDMLMVTPQGLVIVDFKTDNITASQTVARAQIYNKQVRLYSYAVSKILKKSVAAGWLYFLKPAVAYRC